MRKKPCSICRRWFEPNVRAGSRQKVCSTVSCQRERRRRTSAAWRKRNPDWDKENRLRERLKRADRPDPAPPDADPLAGLDWGAVRIAVGVETMVVVEESCKVIANWARIAVGAKTGDKPDSHAKVPPDDVRIAIAARGPPP